jgi:hypothetical protein
MRRNARPIEPEVITSGVIARELGEPIHRVLYVLATRPAIKPEARAGRIRLYKRPAIEQIRHELARIDEMQHPGKEGGEA